MNALGPCLIRGLCQPQTFRTAAGPLTPGPTVTPSHSPEAGLCVTPLTRAGVGLAVRYPQPLTPLTLSGRPHLLFHCKALPFHRVALVLFVAPTVHHGPSVLPPSSAQLGCQLLKGRA